MVVTLKNFCVVALAIGAVAGCGKRESTSDGVGADSSHIQNDSVTGMPASARPVHWSYTDEGGPEGWGRLSPAYALCSAGDQQSPIDISIKSIHGGAKWKLDYKSTSLRIAHTEHMDDIIDNGHTIQVTVDEGSVFTFQDKSYNLKQFHFHTPSEHTIDGGHAPMEMHFVHQGEDGSLAVVGVLCKEGSVENPNLAKIIANLPAAKGESKHITDVNLELKFQLPKDNYAYYYEGSLTTPPCSEGVQWLILRDPILVTSAQVAAIFTRIGSNNRPVQALNNRQIRLDQVTGHIE